MDEAAAVREDAPELKAIAQSRQVTDTPQGEGIDSPLAWTSDAIERLHQVPAGFMRNITQSRIEQRAQETNLETIDLEFTARVIEDGRSLANEVLGSYYEQDE